MLKRVSLMAIGLCMLAVSPPSVAQAAPADVMFTPAQLQQDLRFLRDEIDRIHPDPGMFVSRETLRKAYEKVEEQLQQPLSRDAAWRVLSTLNSVYADAHVGVTYPDLKGLTKAHLAAGGVLFPYEVQVDASGTMRIRTELGGANSALAGVRIERINGVPASRIAQELLARTPGDTPAFQAHNLSRQMWFRYWKVFGAPREFDLVLAKAAGQVRMRVPGSSTLPPTLDADEASSFDKTYHFQLLPGKTALLTVNAFAWPDKPAFYAFTKDAFAKIAAAKVQNLIIDIRENGGGDDDMWKTGLLPYLTDKPYRQTSSYVKKVLAGRASGTEKVGDVVHGFDDTWDEPGPAGPYHFSGKTYVLVGRMTYSSAVLFSNVMQDFGIGKLVGAGGYARTRQTGGLQSATLPNTGLELFVPRFVLDRPSGEREPALIRPDIVLPDSPFDRMQLVNALLEHIRGGTTAAAGTALR